MGNDYRCIFSEKRGNMLSCFIAVHTLKTGIANIGVKLAFLPQKPAETFMCIQNISILSNFGGGFIKSDGANLLNNKYI